MIFVLIPFVTETNSFEFAISVGYIWLLIGKENDHKIKDKFYLPLGISHYKGPKVNFMKHSEKRIIYYAGVWRNAR